MRGPVSHFRSLAVVVFTLVLPAISAGFSGDPSRADLSAHSPKASSSVSASATGAVVAARGALGVAAAPDADAARKSEEEQNAEEHRLRREAERQTQLAEAEELVHTADATVMDRLPYPFNMLLGVSVLGITLWRYLVAISVVGLALYAIHRLRTRFRRANNQLKAEEPLTRWQKAVNVLLVPLRNPVKLVVIGLVIRFVSSLLVTVYHPEIIWVADLIIFLAVVLYLYDLVGIVDRVYGASIFRTGNNRLMETVRPMILRVVRAIIIIIAGTHIYQDLTGRTMVSVLAGLGIGGLALALASQETPS